MNEVLWPRAVGVDVSAGERATVGGRGHRKRNALATRGRGECFHSRGDTVRVGAIENVKPWLDGADVRPPTVGSSVSTAVGATPQWG